MEDCYQFQFAAEAHKYIAGCSDWADDRGAMRLGRRAAACISIVVCAAFLWAIVLAVSPGLHEWIHTDANRVEHACAVTLASSGSYHQSPATPLIAPLAAVQFSRITALAPRWVPSPFLGAHIFEHAPPRNS